jgi:hypothetical protein
VYVGDSAGEPTSTDSLCNSDIDMNAVTGLQEYECSRSTVTNGKGGAFPGRYVKLVREFVAPSNTHGGTGDGVIRLAEAEVLGFYETAAGAAVSSTLNFKMSEAIQNGSCGCSCE